MNIECWVIGASDAAQLSYDINVVLNMIKPSSLNHSHLFLYVGVGQGTLEKRAQMTGCSRRPLDVRTP